MQKKLMIKFFYNFKHPKYCPSLSYFQCCHRQLYTVLYHFQNSEKNNNLIPRNCLHRRTEGWRTKPYLTVCYYHVTYGFQMESTLHSLPECQETPCSKQAAHLKLK